MGLGCGRVPKIIPMQVQGGPRGPSFFKSLNVRKSSFKSLYGSIVRLLDFRTRAQKRSLKASMSGNHPLKDGPLGGHGFDMGVIFATPPPCKPACMGNLIPQKIIFALKAKPLHGAGPMQVQNPYMGVDPCLISNFELSGHQFGTILKSFILTFQCASI